MIRIMLRRAVLLCAALAAVSAQPPSPFFSFSSGGPSSSSPFSSSGGPPPFSSSGGPPPFGSGGPPSSQFGGPFSSSPFGNGGPPPGRPGQGRPPKTQKNPSGNKLFSWIGSTMSKLQGLGPKVHYYPPKSKPSSSGGPSSSPPQNAPPYFSSGGPPRDSFHNSLFDGSSSSPFEGGSVSFASPSHSNSLDHPKVIYRNPSGPPPSYISRPGPPPSYSSSRPSFSSRPPPSYSSGGPPPSFSSGGPPPSFSSGGPPPFSSGGPPSYSSGGPPPSFSSGGPPPFSSSPFSSSRPSFGGPSSSSFHPSQNTRNNLEVFPSQQVSYQSHTLSQNQPGYDEALDSLQNLYGSQSNNRPSYHPNSQSYSNYEQQGSFSQNQPHISKTSANNFGASFHSIEPVRVAPMYDVGQHFKPSSSDMSGAASSVHHKQQPSNIHDTPFATIVNDYAAHADAATAGSEQMLSALQGQDMATSASTNQGVQIMGQGAGPNANPIFEVVADANAPTYDGHPVDLNRLISMIEPGAQIDTMPSYSDADMGSSEQHPIYAEAPSNLELESDAAMASGIMSGNKNNASEKSQTQLNNLKTVFNNINDKLKSVASESRPTVVKLDGTRLNDEKLIQEHFDKEIILDDLQENKDHGFIIVGVHTDNDTGDEDEDEHLHGTNKNRTLINSFDSNKNNQNDNDDLLAIVQQLRNSATSAVVDRLKNDSESLLVTPTPNNKNVSDSSDQVEKNRTTPLHPNHNYFPELSAKVTLEDTNEHDDSETRLNTPVINPIVDTVRQNSFSDVDADDNGNSSLTLKTDNDHDYDNDKSQSIEDNEDDDGYMFPDDMIVSTDGDLAASGARNVKSVAIIVTPPPNYVKIRNKYKKAITPLSAMMSSTTPLPNNASSILPTTTSESININETFSESLTKPNSNSNITSENEQSRHVIDDSSISADNNSLPSNSSGLNNDSILNVSTISSGIDSNHFSSTNNSTSNSMLIENNNKQTRRYPVYRGKSNA